MKELRLGEELRAEIEALRGLDSEAFEQVANIAAAQLRSGAPGAKAVKNAAAALAVGPEELAAALEALSFVIAEAARLQPRLPGHDLRAALQEQLPLSGEAVGRLVQVTPRARSGGGAEGFGPAKRVACGLMRRIWRARAASAAASAASRLPALSALLEEWAKIAPEALCAA